LLGGVLGHRQVTKKQLLSGINPPQAEPLSFYDQKMHGKPYLIPEDMFVAAIKI
jgi:hypothetical protein